MNLFEKLEDLIKMASKTDIRNTVAIISVVLSFAFLGIILFKPIPEQNRDIVNVIGGLVLGVACNSVFGYLYTTDKSSVKKDQTSQ